jgi:hypothetical protein
MTRVSGTSTRWPEVRIQTCVHISYGAYGNVDYVDGDTSVLLSNSRTYGDDSGNKLHLQLQIDLKRCDGTLVESRHLPAEDDHVFREIVTQNVHAASKGDSFQSVASLVTFEVDADGSVWTAGREDTTAACLTAVA